MAEWKGLLLWSMKYMDGTKPSPAKEMKKEDREWLEKVMKEMVVDTGKRMQVLVATLRVPEDGCTNTSQNSDAKTDGQPVLYLENKSGNNEPNPVPAPMDAQPDALPEPVSQAVLDEIVSKKLDALTELEDLVLHIDHANDLHKVGGLIPLINILKSKHDSLRGRAGRVLSTVCQNNPKSQQWALEAGVVPLLVDALRSIIFSEHPQVLAPCITAVSALVRSNKDAEQQFVSQGGVIVLESLFLAENTALRVTRKALQLLTFFWSRPKTSKLNEHRAPDIIKRILHFTEGDDVDCREGSAKALKVLSQDSKDVLTDPTLGVRRVVESRLRVIEEEKDPEELELLQLEKDLLSATISNL